ncbi:MAG: branched-chain amino acid ABC transporter substrate-binding protein [Rhizobiales bacterium 62-17]|nr:ABC transporter substrate-binding protein [Hyphomicrobiales bacterium]OJY04515.1 MAG: branched-chain amino acid ABC transporter substrate-binding protein [Rhizobiales bacterium 62-17]
MNKIATMAGLFLLASTAAQAEIKVGFVTSLSGPAASTGQPLARGVAAASAYMGTIGDKKIRLIQLDDSSDPTSAARNARKLIEEENVDVLMGSSNSPSSIAIAAVASELKVPMIALAPITAVKREPDDYWSICVIQPPPLMIEVIADRMARDGIKNVGYIGFSDAWGDLVYNGAKAAEAGAGLKILTNERYARSDSSVTGQILKVLAARPEGILLGGSGTQGALPALALAERGYKGPIYGTSPLVNPDFVRVGGRAVEGINVSTGPVVVAEQLPDDHFSKSISMAFREAYSKINGGPPTDGISAYAFDAWLIIQDAGKRALAQAKPGTSQFRSALKNAIFSTVDLKGTHSIYNFKSGQVYGADKRGFVVVRLEKGAWKYVP